MIKKLPFKLHQMYEIWNEHAAESVYFNRKPTKLELRILARKNWWCLGRERWTDAEVDQFVRDFIRVTKMDNLWYDDSEVR